MTDVQFDQITAILNAFAVVACYGVGFVCGTWK
ncbi:hypothetical protein E5CHR_04294 [Variovorax sp. PBL-E5]|nr:hypothetical protein E5CHR_04294 [Variovorax sp. PBL-E5]